MPSYPNQQIKNPAAREWASLTFMTLIKKYYKTWLTFALASFFYGKSRLVGGLIRA